MIDHPHDPNRLPRLIDRLARLSASEVWEADLNPSQFAVLDYLSAANRFSTSPSHVAAYLGATRGTVSQTLKALVRKGLIEERRDEGDKRVVHMSLTDAGRELLARPRDVSAAVAQVDGLSREELERVLATVLAALVRKRDGKVFGLCHACAHHREVGGGRRCALLDVALTSVDAEQICHEFDAGDAP